MSFKILRKSKNHLGRKGILKTAHGSVQTPFFLPIATLGAVKTLDSDTLKSLGAQIILANTYHLWQKPGLGVIKKAGGLHKFMNWSGPILTDSGGYQVFSLAKSRRILEKGVEFISDINGQKHLLAPEKAIEIQKTLGSDIMMSLDECTPYPCSKKYAQKSLELTTQWAERGLNYFKKKRVRKLLFGIVQGSIYKELRLQSAGDLVSLNFNGYAIGGLSVGEPVKKMYQVLDWVIPELPENKPRYLMGVGRPEQIVEAVKRGVDMFDCVIPTRNARHGMLYVYTGSREFPPANALGRAGIRGGPNKFGPTPWYKELRIKQAKYRLDMRPIDSHCDCYACQNYSRAYLRHLFMVKEPLGWRLATLHNLKFYLQLMQIIRKEI